MNRMHVHTVRTKFTFDDRIRYRSNIDGRSKTGTILAITFGPIFIEYIVRNDIEGNAEATDDDAATLLTNDQSDTPVVQ